MEGPVTDPSPMMKGEKARSLLDPATTANATESLAPSTVAEESVEV
jgi:hypothetical protein